MVYRICFMRLKSAEEAEDAVQDIFLRYLKKPKEFSDSEHEKAWFITAARNYCKDVFKFCGRHRRVDMESLPEQAEMAGSPENEESELFEKLMSLPEKYREILYLYYYEDYPTKEIAKLLGRNESTVRTQLSKGRERLKKLLQK
ncbi:MAG: sigma-70 family RNA polymerase sigma factor [Ruminococcus sp.]|nr:sigma-70 family RNA polymerase sigma factor [Ruminococcus sp.]